MNPVTYQLVIHVSQSLKIQVGRFGEFEFPEGYYRYTGSAKKNLEARLARHLAKEKKLRWHIDYLLAAPGVTVREVFRFVEGECLINQSTEGSIPVPGFGASDCPARCGSHLKKVG